MGQYLNICERRVGGERNEAKTPVAFPPPPFSRLGQSLATGQQKCL